MDNTQVTIGSSRTPDMLNESSEHRVVELAATMHTHTHECNECANTLTLVFEYMQEVHNLISAITPKQIEQVQKVAQNPILSKMFGGLFE